MKKKYINSKKEKGNIYFFERTDVTSKNKSLAYIFVPETANVTTNMELMNAKHTIDIGKTNDDIIKEVKTDFYYRGRQRYLADNSSSVLDYLNNYEGEY